MTFLHVFHHAVMPLLMWVQARFFPGGQNVATAITNGAVHVFMYAYYFIAALGPKYR